MNASVARFVAHQAFSEASLMSPACRRSMAASYIVRASANMSAASPVMVKAVSPREWMGGLDACGLAHAVLVVGAGFLDGALAQVVEIFHVVPGPVAGYFQAVQAALEVGCHVTGQQFVAMEHFLAGGPLGDGDQQTAVATTLLFQLLHAGDAVVGGCRQSRRHGQPSLR